MSFTTSLRPTPSKYIYQELRKEFTTERIFLNHYEFVDFAVFEYGQRPQYLQWRVFSILMIMLMIIHNLFPANEPLQEAPHYSRFIFMHSWLAILVFLHTLIEALLLAWFYFSVPNPILVRIHYTPWYFKLLWLTFNAIYPNIMSCNVMYYVVVKSIESTLGESVLFISLLACFCGIHVSVTAVPTRLAHIIHPMLLNLIYIVFTVVYQLNGLKDPFGHGYIYQEMDWCKSRRSAINCAVTWVTLTGCFHVVMVWCCWFRRLVYRNRRKRSSTPVYMISPKQYYPCFEDGAKMFEYDISLWDEDHKSDILAEDEFSRRNIPYSPHISYRDLSTFKVSSEHLICVGTFASPNQARPTSPFSGDSLDQRHKPTLMNQPRRKLSCQKCRGNNITLLTKVIKLSRTSDYNERNRSSMNKTLFRVRTKSIVQSRITEPAKRLGERMNKSKPKTKARLICKDCGFISSQREMLRDYKKRASRQKIESVVGGKSLGTETLYIPQHTSIVYTF